jgi:hypothetical protein
MTGLFLLLDLTLELLAIDYHQRSQFIASHFISVFLDNEREAKKFSLFSFMDHLSVDYEVLHKTKEAHVPF